MERAWRILRGGGVFWGWGGGGGGGGGVEPLGFFSTPSLINYEREIEGGEPDIVSASTLFYLLQRQDWPNGEKGIISPIRSSVMKREGGGGESNLHRMIASKLSGGRICWVKKGRKERKVDVIIPSRVFVLFLANIEQPQQEKRKKKRGKGGEERDDQLLSNKLAFFSSNSRFV